jgi:hypothetical protein
VRQVVVADVVVHEAVASEAMSFSGPATSAADVVGDFVAGADALDDHQIENVQRDGDVAAEDFGELAVVLVERGGWRLSMLKMPMTLSCSAGDGQLLWALSRPVT